MKVLRIAGIVLVVLTLLVVIATFVMASRLEGKMAMPNTPYPAVTASADPAVIARGEYLVRTVGHCTQCHADYPRTEPAKNTNDAPMSGGFEFAMGPMGTLYAANITPDLETGIGKRTDAELARTIASGVLADGQLSIFMRYSVGDFSTEDLTAMVSYLRSVPPTKNAVKPSTLTTMGKAMFSMFEFTADLKPPPAHVERSDEPSVARGEYLADNVSLCVACHSHIDMSTFMPTGPKAGGGDPDPSPEEGSGKEFVPPNLTSDATGVTGKLTEDQFVERLKLGRAHVASKMPWENFTRMSDGDMRSIYRYLKTLPPVKNDVGPTYRDQGWKAE